MAYVPIPCLPSSGCRVSIGSSNGRGGRAMTVRVVAAAVLVMMAMPAQAQMGGRHHGRADKTEPKKPQVDDKAYKAALERIHDSKEKYDPWGVARPVDPAKKPK